MVLSGPAPRVPPNGGLALSLVPHDGRVYIDDSGEGQLVTHTLTLRQQMAPIEGGPWSLHMDSDGFGALLSDSGETVILLEEWLTRQLYQCDEGDWIVLQAGEGKSQPASSWNLTARMREFVAHPIFLNNGAGQSQVTAFLMEWPRGGFKWQWPAQDLYRVLGMTSYKGQSSKWLYNSVSVWEAAMEAFGFQGHFVRSEASKPPDIGMSSVKYCLPSTSMSTLAVFVLLVQWQARSARRGGLRQDRDRHRCSALLRTFVDGVLSVPFLLDLSFHEQESPAWPRPSPPCDCKFSFAVARDGMVDVSAWRQQVSGQELDLFQPGQRVMLLWWGKISQLVNPSGKIALLTLLAGDLSDDPGFAPAWRQIVWQLASRLEVNILRSRSMTACDWTVRAETIVKSDKWTCREVDRTCTTHIAATRRASCSHQFIGIAVDKVGGCRSLDLQNAFCVLPSNIGFELIPQVVGHFGATPCPRIALGPTQAPPTMRESPQHRLFLRCCVGGRRCLVQICAWACWRSRQEHFGV